MLAAFAVPFVLAGTASPTSPPVSVFPIAGSRLAARQTQISFRGVASSAIGSISVTGSISGPHNGRMVADSDRRGASFYPNRPFTAGEVVTVRTGLNIVRGTGGTFRFTIERSWGAIPPPVQRAVAPRQRGDTQSFHSRPDLTPVSIDVDKPYSGAGDVLLTPMHGPTQWGPMIIGPRGSLIWFDPMPGSSTIASNLRVQRYLGQPVLTLWEGYVNVNSGQGVDVILNRHYQQIATVRAGNGLMADLHEFIITAQNTALITAYSLVHWDGSGVGRGKDMDVVDCTVQEIDIRTGNVLFQWDSLGHIGLQDSYLAPATNPGVPYDYFHANSIQQDSDGNLIVSARDTWTVYKINASTGAVMWKLGGKHSSFKMGPGTRTAYQHDATLHAGNVMSIFDDGGGPRVHPESRAVFERLNTRTMTATLVRAFDHRPPLRSNVEGSVEERPAGRTFVGWGDAPYFTEYDRRGRQIFDGRLRSANSSYRAYEFSWDGQPLTQPALAVHKRGHRVSTVYASWNGATDVASWRVLAGSAAGRLHAVGAGPRRGFESVIKVHTKARYFAVQALDSAGHELAESAAVKAGG
jgi:hypothetical protein